MKHLNKIFIPVLLITFIFQFGFQLHGEKLIREIQIKEGARKIIKINVDTYLDQDPTIAKLLKTETENQAVIIGLSMGKTEIICEDKNNVETLLKITVVPRYWDTLEYLFADNPNISLKITEGHLIISGKVIQNSLLKKVAEAVKLDDKRIINNVTFSHEDLLKRIQNYLKTENYDYVKAECMDKTVYLSGNIFDKKKRDDLISVLESYAKPAGFTLNSSGIHLNGSPLTVEVRFVSLDKGKNDNIGLTFEDIQYSMDFTPTASHIYDSSNTTRNVIKKAGIDGQGSINTKGNLNLTKQKSALKILYATNLSTRSGEMAKLQRGGTIYEKIEGVQAVDLKEIDYGFIVEVTPTLLNEDTIDADVNIQVSQPGTATPLNVTKYTMKAKYTVAPGEIILINKMNQINDNITKEGIPILSDLPVISYLFESDNVKDTNSNLLLLLRISFQGKDKIKKEGKAANKNFIKAKNTQTHVDMNIFESLVDEYEDVIDKEENNIEKEIQE